MNLRIEKGTSIEDAIEQIVSFFEAEAEGYYLKDDLNVQVKLENSNHHEWPLNEKNILLSENTTDSISREAIDILVGILHQNAEENLKQLKRRMEILPSLKDLVGIDESEETILTKNFNTIRSCFENGSIKTYIIPCNSIESEEYGCYLCFDDDEARVYYSNNEFYLTEKDAIENLVKFMIKNDQPVILG